jgi:hypothetical protein
MEFPASSRPSAFLAAAYSGCPSTHAFPCRAMSASSLDLRDKSSVPRTCSPDKITNTRHIVYVSFSYFAANPSSYHPYAF